MPRGRDTQCVLPRRRLARSRVGQVMRLVEDEQIERLAVALEQSECRVVSRHGDRCDVLLVTVPRTDTLTAECISELTVPLRDQCTCRRDDAAARTCRVQRQHRHEALARAGRQHHAAAAVRAQPALDRLLLVVARCARIEQRDRVMSRR